MTRESAPIILRGFTGVTAAEGRAIMSVARAHRRRYFGLLSAGAALSALALSPVLTGTAHAGSLPAPAFASVSAATGDVVTSPVEGPAKPTVITQAGGTVDVTVSLWTSSAMTTAAAFNKDTDVRLTSGGVSVTRTFRANATSQVFTTGAFGAAVNQTTVSVSFPGLKGKSAIPGANSPTVFDVLTFVAADTAGPGYTRNVGKGGATCGEVTAQEPFCATVLLPKGAGSIVARHRPVRQHHLHRLLDQEQQLRARAAGQPRRTRVLGQLAGDGDPVLRQDLLRQRRDQEATSRTSPAWATRRSRTCPPAPRRVSDLRRTR